MNNTLETLSKIGIVPVIAIEDAADAEELAKALYEGGLPTAEVTFRTSAAEEAIKIMHSAYPDMIIGAGTVLTPEQADKAISAGATFIVSPGFNPDVVKHCLKKGYTVLPGVATPSELEGAMALGLDNVKFFPAEAAGGIAMIKAMSAPYGKIKFMPTGGINESNLNDYLSFGKIIACGGSWMATKQLIKDKQFDKIKAMTSSAVDKMLGLRLHHVGINADAEGAVPVANLFSNILGTETTDGNVSAWAGGIVEVMKGCGRGKYGHVALSANNVDRAVYHLERRGIVFDYTSAKYNDDGSMKFIYSSGDFGGFAFHIVKN